jgi:hypothetical protein
MALGDALGTLMRFQAEFVCNPKIGFLKQVNIAWPLGKGTKTHFPIQKSSLCFGWVILKSCPTCILKSWQNNLIEKGVNQYRIKCLDPTSCFFIDSGPKTGYFLVLDRVISMGYTA